MAQPYELKNKNYQFSEAEKNAIDPHGEIPDLTASIEEFAKSLKKKLSKQDSKDAVLKILDELVDHTNDLNDELRLFFYKNLGRLSRDYYNENYSN